MSENDFGVQPLDAMMTKLGLSNLDLVSASTEQLSFKMIQRGRKGRRLTLNAQKKICEALKKAKPGANYELSDLFQYDKPEHL